MHGLPNIGNSCFMNSVLQCLFSCKHFRSALDRGGRHPVVNLLNMICSGDTRSSELVMLLNDLRKMVMGKQLQGRHLYHQQDASEFMFMLMENIEKVRSMKDLKGCMQVVTECVLCGNKEVRDEEFMTIVIAIDRSRTSVLNELINKNYVPVKIVDRNCEKCGSKNASAIRQHFLSKCPKILAVVVNRFQSDMRKCSEGIDIPSIMRLNVGDMLASFELRSVCVHNGSSCDNGHYVAACYDAHDASIVMVDDDSMQLVSNTNTVQEMLCSSGYIYFYEH